MINRAPTPATPTAEEEELADAIINAFAPQIPVDSHPWILKIIVAHRPAPDALQNMLDAVSAYRLNNVAYYNQLQETRSALAASEARAAELEKKLQVAESRKQKAE